MAHPPDQNLKSAPLDSLHRELDAKMVPFAGYAMPVNFQGIIAEHQHTRENAGLFDVSHMGQAIIRGADAARALEKVKFNNDDQRVGVDIIRRSLQIPTRQIAENAGEDGAVVAGKLLENKKLTFGFNAQTGKYTDMVAAGVLDPTKVVRTALQDAASIAGLLVTTEAMVAEKPERKDTPPMMPGGGMGDMGGMGGF